MMVVLGFLFPTIVDALFFALHVKPQENTSESKYELEVTVEAQVAQPPVKPVNDAELGERMRVLLGVLFGDAMHNLCDGMFIGAAFRYCGESRAWSIAIVSILHELPQEVVDFILLTGKVPDRVRTRCPSLAYTVLPFAPLMQGKLMPLHALILNFISGSSVILGVVIINSIEVSPSVIGLVLAFAGGTYLHIGCAEAMPMVYANVTTVRSRIAAIIAFAMGATAIGLILLDHRHCSWQATPDGHSADDGHGH